MQSFTHWVSHLNPIKILVLAGFFVFGAGDVGAQSTEVRLSVSGLTPARVAIAIKGEPARTWSFRNTYGNIVGLGDRIQNIRGSDGQGRAVALQRDAPGEFHSTQDVGEISYEVSLMRPLRPADLSRVSWLDTEYGLIMLGDLLPHNTIKSFDLIFDLPTTWDSASSINSTAIGRYHVEAAEKAVFIIGKSVRLKKVKLGSARFSFITIGAWPFNDSAVRKVAEKLIQENIKILQTPLPGDSALILAPFPGVTPADLWTAETRGPTVVLLLGNHAQRNASLARLRVVLAHEFFHLWVPNSLKLQGDYDWFFEGFTVYQALLTALRLGYIKFEDYLETLSRVYDSYRSSKERDKLSLLEASERRWTTASTVVYDRGVLVAFIYDLMRRRQGGSQATMSDVYPEVLRTASGQEANEFLMTILNRREGMDGFSEKFVRSSAEIELESFLSPFGLQFQSSGSRFQIRVSNTINAEQHRLLKTLGYKRRP